MRQKIETLTKEFLENLGANGATIEVVEDAPHTKILITVADDRPIAGSNGENFEAFSHLLKRMVAKVLGEESKVSIDLNNRQGKIDELLKAKAEIVAQRVKSFKMDIEMEPMSSYERMVIHTFLEPNKDVVTESIGFGKDRRLVVKFVGE